MNTAVEALTCRTIDSPIGPLTLAGVGTTLTRLVIAGQRHQPQRCDWGDDDQAFPDVVVQLRAYFEGELTRFDIECRLDGTEFQRRVWIAVQSIPYGHTRSYAAVADQIGSPGASRAVGLAVGRNPMPIIVGCHRVIGSAGGLTGYVGGVGCKQALLALETTTHESSKMPV